MALELRDCSFFGPALPAPFVKLHLEGELKKRKLLPRSTGDEGRALQDRWEVYRRKLRALGEHGGERRVANHVLEPLVERLGYERLELQAEVITREGPEKGGWLFTAADGRVLRVWSFDLGVDLDAPSRRGRAYRFSPSRVAQRVLLARGERAGLLTDGEELRLLLCDPARPDSHISVQLDRSGGWRAARRLPDSYRLLLALTSPDGIAALPDLAEAARLAQSTVTKKLRLQARRAIEGFLQELLDHPQNAAVRQEWSDPAELARALWREGLILVYRLLFVLKLESSADPARAFSFKDTSLWRKTYSPNTALACLVRRVLDEGAETGGFLEGGLRTLWRMFAEGMSSSELEVKPLGGMLFGAGTTPLLDRMTWGERGVAKLLDALLWTPGDGKAQRERVHYGSLDVEDLGRVYEALLELEPGISTESMCRLRRAKLEVVVPLAQGAPYRADLAPADAEEDDDPDIKNEDGGDEGEAPKRRSKVAAVGKSKVQFVEEIPQDRFFLRVGLGRKASGSYYTPHPFVRFLVQETLGPQLDERSPKEDPRPGRILDLKVLDPAMGSGHFLVEVCRYLGEALYEACRLCDELAVQAEERAEKASDGERETLLAHAAELRKRVEDLPDPENELVAYLPSRAAEGEESGLSQKKAEALCRRLVAVHCLYGVDKNPLAVELAKLSLWLESYAEGLPLTFMDHRLIQGDSLTGPFFEHLLTYPKSGEKLDDLFAQGLTERLKATLEAALVQVRDLEATIGKDVADLEHKRTAKEKLDAALAPLKTLAAAWSGGVMLGDECDDAGYLSLAEAVAEGEKLGDVMVARPRLREMVSVAADGVPYELTFPEAFAINRGARGFDAVLGNPPWDKPHTEEQQFYANFAPDLWDMSKRSDWWPTAQKLLSDPAVAEAHRVHSRAVESLSRALRIDLEFIERVTKGRIRGHVDVYFGFAARAVRLVSSNGQSGLLLGGGWAKNPAARQLRVLCLTETEGRWALQFDNRNRLFTDLPRILEFCVVVTRGNTSVASRKPRTSPLRVATRLGSFEALTASSRSPNICARETLEQLARAGDQLSLSVLTAGKARMETRNQRSLFDTIEYYCGPVIQEINTSSDPNIVDWQDWLTGCKDPRLQPILSQCYMRGWLVVLAGRSISDYEGLSREQKGRWSPVPVHLAQEGGNRLDEALHRARHFRLAYRIKCGSPTSNERSMRAAIIPPMLACSHALNVQKDPESRPSWMMLVGAAVLNTYRIDGLLRPQIQVMISNALLKDVEGLDLGQAEETFLVHAALRLSVNTAQFSPLWTDQLGGAWREPVPKHTWPVLDGDDARWAVRAAIDAVVADAYGLDRAQYEHVLSSFSHKSYPKAPELCLAAFDELKAIGLEAFTKKHDPYWDIPLNESLPKPVIDLPVSGEEKPAPANLGPLFDRTEEEAAAPAETVAPPPGPPAPPQPVWMARRPIDRQVLILSRVVDAHQRADRLHTMGNVKAEKIIYLVEAHAGIDLERAPVREAAGPADFPRLKKAVHRGSKLHAFSVRGGSGGTGGVWSPGGGLRKRLGEYSELFSAERPEIDRIIDLLVPKNSEQAEIVATLYACWNDLLARGAQPDDMTIIEDFHGWAEGKRRFDAGRLGKALGWMREHDLVPSGTAPLTKARVDGNRKKVRSQKQSNAADDEVYAIVRSLLGERGVISSKDAQQATGLDAAGVRPHLERLVQEGRAVTEGQRRGMKYRRANG